MRCDSQQTGNIEVLQINEVTNRSRKLFDLIVYRMSYMYCYVIQHTPDVESGQINEVGNRSRKLFDLIHYRVSLMLACERTSQVKVLEAAHEGNGIGNEFYFVGAHVQPDKAVLLNSSVNLLPFLDGRFCFSATVLTLLTCNQAKSVVATIIVLFVHAHTEPLYDFAVWRVLNASKFITESELGHGFWF